MPVYLVDCMVWVYIGSKDLGTVENFWNPSIVDLRLVSSIKEHLIEIESESDRGFFGQTRATVLEMYNGDTKVIDVPYSELKPMFITTKTNFY